MRVKCIWQQGGFIFAPFMGELLQQMLFSSSWLRIKQGKLPWVVSLPPTVRKLSFLLLLLLGCWTCNIDKAVNQKRGKENHQIASLCKAQSILLFGGQIVHYFLNIIFCICFFFFESKTNPVYFRPPLSRRRRRDAKTGKKGGGGLLFLRLLYSRVTFFQTRRRRKRKGNKITPEKKKKKNSPPLVSICQM